MPRTKRHLSLFLALLLALPLTACADAVTDLTVEPVHIAATPAAEFTSADNMPAAAADEIAERTNGFAFRFTEALLSRSEPDSNFVCSPFSAWLPLAALVNAAEPEVRPQLLASLGETGLSAEQLNEAARTLLASLTRERRSADMREQGLDVHNPLSIASALFVDQEARVNTSFADVFGSSYGGACMSVDFASDEAVGVINKWADDHTHGLIQEIVAPGTFSPETTAAIASAIYFADRWNWEFAEEDTAPGSFHAPDGSATAQFMLHEGSLPYAEDETMQAVQLDFVTGGSMLIMLPKDGDAPGLLSGMGPSRLRQLQADLEEREGRLLLPRFGIESGVMQLKEVLETLGIPLFDNAPPALTSLVDGQTVFISQAVQSARIEVDERGTTAAAVTAMALAGAALREPGEPFEMICDSPFVFVLLGEGAGLVDPVLFTGVVCRPA